MNSRFDDKQPTVLAAIDHLAKCADKAPMSGAAHRKCEYYHDWLRRTLGGYEDTMQEYVMLRAKHEHDRKQRLERAGVDDTSQEALAAATSEPPDRPPVEQRQSAPPPTPAIAPSAPFPAAVTPNDTLAKSRQRTRA